MGAEEKWASHIASAVGKQREDRRWKGALNSKSTCNDPLSVGSTYFLNSVTIWGPNFS